MNISKDIDWYRQAAECRLLFVGTPAKAVVDSMKFPTVYTLSEEFEAYFDRKTMIKEAKEFFYMSLSSREPIDRYYKDFLSRLIDFSSLEQGDISYDSIMEMDKKNYDLWYRGFLPDFFDPVGDGLINKALAKYNLSPDEIHILLKPERMNFLEEIRHSSKTNEEIKKEFYYAKSSWGIVQEVTDEDIERIRDTIPEKNMLDPKEIEKRLDERTRNIVYLFRKLSEIRDLRKVTVLKANYFYDRYLKRYKNDLYYYSLPSEIEEIDESELKRRKIAFVMSNMLDKFISGKEALDVVNELHDIISKGNLNGNPAYAFSSEIKGNVKIILSEKDFHKFNDGDILIASMTRPEYLPLMRKAKAIITDEGGVTSHAAIISRELKIPCVIGTQIATKSLKDGDNVSIKQDGRIIKNNK